MASFDNINLEIHRGVARIVINRPRARNALSKATNLEISKACSDIANQTDIRAVVVTGAGEKAFCAGADLKERKGVPASENWKFVEAISSAINDIGALPQPTIAVMNGSAFGGGLELALACDFRIGVNDIVMALTEVRLGIMPGAGGTQRLPRVVGMAKAKELILTGKRVSAQEAVDMGLLNGIAPREELSQLESSWLQDLRACAPISLRQSKKAIERGMELPLEQALELERECYDVTVVTEDRNEGLAAFAEKRAPEFKGR